MTEPTARVRPLILVVDDDEDVRRILRETLSEFASVLEAADGPQALALIQKQRPRAVLLDAVMPGMDGFDVLVEALRIAPGLPVLMLTGRTDIASAREALDLGAREYITKPFDPFVLRDELKRVLSTAADGGEDRPWRVRA